MAQLIDRKIENFFAQFPRRVYEKDQIIIHAGDEPQYVFYLVSGKVRQHDITYRGDDVILNVMKSGTFFPMQWALTAMENKYFYVAESDVEMRLAPVDATVVFLNQNPDVVMDFLVRVYKGIDGMQGRMVQLMSGTAQSRVLYELLIECQRFGERAEDGSCFVGINESELAARAGLSRETVSREMHKIGTQGLAHVSHSGILVQNIEELQRKLSTET